MTETAGLEAIAARFRRFAEQEAAGYSPLYERLALGVAGDADLLRLASNVQPGQPYPNMLLGAVHYLLLRDGSLPLARFYPSLVHAKAGKAAPAGLPEPVEAARPEPVEGPAAQRPDPFPAFREFCLDHIGAIEEILRTHRVQTNEVGRSAGLLPAFNHVSSISNAPLALIEIGASAGLNLLCDRYFYDYGEAGNCGDRASPVRLRCRVIGGNRPPIGAVPAIAYRVGVDLNPIDIGGDEAVAWLRALVWPEHHERAAALLAAVDVARNHPPAVVQGDGIEMLASLLESVPPDTTVCVVHSFVLNQVSREARGRLYETLAEYAWRRPVFDISFEHSEGTLAMPVIEMSRPVRGEWRRALLAKCHAHGASIEWLL